MTAEEMSMDTICLLLIVAGVGPLIFPLVHYIRIGWQAKRKDILDSLNAEARLAYFKMFNRSETSPESATAASTEFETLYSTWYGRKFFVAPGLLLLLAGVMAVTIVALTGLHRLHYFEKAPLFNLPNAALAAIAGAYLWVVDDFISRARRLDFTPSDVMWGVLRLTIAIPMGYAFAAVAAKSVGPFIAFALGAFPLATLTSVLRRLTNKSLGIEATPDEANDAIIQLQGVNQAIVERLSNEDITTITQIAYCDPVRLVMRSNLSFNFVLDCMDQALAWIYLQGKLDTIRPLGVRGATEIQRLMQDFDRTAPMTPEQQAAHDQAVAAFPLIAAAVKQDPATLQLAFRQIARDPFTDFLCRVWT
jgi:hypothetical protein